MPPARTLREAFAELAGDEGARDAHAANPGGFLAAAGHPDLPGGLVAEAVVSYADTAPMEVAEHLAPYVAAHSAVPAGGVEGIDQQDWFEMLSAAPSVALARPPLTEDDGAGDVAGAAAADAEMVDGEMAAEMADGEADGTEAATEHAALDLDFGRGAGAGWAGAEQPGGQPSVDRSPPADPADGLGGDDIRHGPEIGPDIGPETGPDIGPDIGPELGQGLGHGLDVLPDPGTLDGSGVDGL